MAFLLVVALAAGQAAAQTARPGYKPAPVPAPAPKPPATATVTAPNQPLAPGSTSLRIGGRMVTGVGVTSDSGAGH